MTEVDADIRVILKDILGSIMLDDELMVDMRYLCDVVGPRPAGSEGEIQARDYLARRLTEAGIEDVHFEAFAAPHWTRGPTTATIMKPIQRSIDVLALPLNASHQLVAEATWSTYTTASEFRKLGIDVNGKVCVSPAVTVTGRNVRHRKQRVQIAHDNGAKCFLWSSHIPGNVLPTGSMDPTIAATMPALGTTQEDGYLIERLAQHSGVVLEISTENDTREGTSWNVVGDLPGEFDEVVMITAHLDSHDITAGAFDNAAGCAIVLACARALARTRQRGMCGVRFAIFSAEEVGLVGSTAYVDQHAEDMSNVRFMLNLDGLGVAPSTKYLHVPFNDALATYINRLYERFGFGVRVEKVNNMNWDHAPFALQGVPSASLTSAWPVGTNLHFGHTRADTLEKIDPQDLRYAACCAALLGTSVARDTSWDVEHIEAGVVNQQLAAAGA